MDLRSFKAIDDFNLLHIEPSQQLMEYYFMKLCLHGKEKDYI